MRKRDRRAVAAARAVRLGYKLSSEERGPRELVRLARQAEETGFGFGLISDHFHPLDGPAGSELVRDRERLTPSALVPSEVGGFDHRQDRRSALPHLG